MRFYRHIVVAADFSAPSEAAAHKAAELVQCTGAELTLLHVVDYFPEDIPNECIAPEDQDPEHYLCACCKEALSSLATDIGAVEARVEVVVTTQSAANGILDYADEHSIDLVVLAAHGRKGIAAMLGSTVEHVLHHAKMDIVVVRSH